MFESSQGHSKNKGLRFCYRKPLQLWRLGGDSIFFQQDEVYEISDTIENTKTKLGAYCADIDKKLSI